VLNIVIADLVAPNQKVVEGFLETGPPTHLLENGEYFGSDNEHVLAPEQHFQDGGLRYLSQIAC